MTPRQCIILVIHANQQTCAITLSPSPRFWGVGMGVRVIKTNRDFEYKLCSVQYHKQPVLQDVPSTYSTHTNVTTGNGYI